MGRKLRAFISSTQKDLFNERAAVIKCLEDLNIDPVNAERWQPDGKKPWDRIEKEIKTSDIFILILGYSYGRIPTDGPGSELKISITHLEFRTAREEGKGEKKILPFLKRLDYETDPKSNDAKKRDSFRAEVRDWAKGYLAGTFEAATDLAEKVTQSVSRLLDEYQLRVLAQDLLGSSPTVKKYIPLTLTKHQKGLRKDWKEAFSTPEFHLVHAASGCGKTTLLKHIASQWLSEAPESDGFIPFYLHLVDLQTATLVQVLQQKFLQCTSQPGNRLPRLLQKLQDEGRLVYLLDGYDQVEDGDDILDRNRADWEKCIVVVATRKPSDATLSAYAARKNFTVWALDPVSPKQANEYLRDFAGSGWVSGLRKNRSTREMLRIPLFLEMLAAVKPDDPSANLNDARLIGHYWDWQTHQEDQARKAGGRKAVTQSDWYQLKKQLVDSAWRLALDGCIERFKDLDEETVKRMEPLRKLFAELDLKKFDFVSIEADGGCFRHQSFQAYLAATAIASELRTADSTSIVLSQVLEQFDNRFPERFRPSLKINQQLSFWQEACGFVPAVLGEAFGGDEGTVEYREWEPGIWNLVRSLAGHGLFLLAWRVVLRAQEDGKLESYENGWREVLWQIVRYRRDSEDHFPLEDRRWLYDPLPGAVAAIDRWVANKEDRTLREGLGHALKQLKGPLIQTLGMYELMMAYLEWPGGDSDLDLFRAPFVIGKSDGNVRLLDTRKRFLTGGECYDGSSRNIASIKFDRPGTTLLVADDGRFGEWLQQEFTSSGEDPDIGELLEEFAYNSYAKDSNPHTEPFCRWLGERFVQYVLENKTPPQDVSLRIFDADWNRGIRETVRNLSLESFQKLVEISRAMLGSPDLKRQIAAAVLLGRIVHRIKDQECKLNLFKEPAWQLFQNAAAQGDIDLAYTGYHEAARFVDEYEKVCTLQNHIKRYYPEEIRWFDPYVSGDQIDFVLRHIGDESPYPRKKWLYCFEVPMLLEHGTNAAGKNVDTVLDECAKPAGALRNFEAEALTWARNAVDCMRRL